jgi:CheY-like chemotaxis protein
MDGYEATRRIRQQELGINRKVVIAVTASARAEDRQRCFDAGMDDYLSKPFQFSELAQVLQRWVGSLDAPGSLGVPDNAATDWEPVSERSNFVGV